MIYYYLSIFLFCLGMVGVVIKANFLAKLLCIELMIVAVCLLHVLLSRVVGSLDAFANVFFVLIVAVVEVGVGLSLIISLFKKYNSFYIEGPE